MSDLMVVCDKINSMPHVLCNLCRNPRPASPALVEGERQELLGKEGVGAALAGVVAAVDRCGCFNLGGHAHYCHEAMDAAREALAAAPPISLEEQVTQLKAAASDLRARLEKLTLEQAAKAQPDAQDLTEEEIDRLEWAVRHAVQPSVSELVPRLLTEVKRRRGIK